MSLSTDIDNELQREVHRKFPSRNVEIEGLNNFYQADLVEIRMFAKIYKSYKYILVVIDGFRKICFGFSSKI